MSQLEEKLVQQLKVLGLDHGMSREYRFAAQHVGLGSGIKKRLQSAGLRDWRFDAAWPSLRIACEVEGGGWIGGRHNRGKGFHEDLRKYDAAMRLGWVIYRCAGDLIESGRAVDTILRIMEDRHG